MENGTSDESRLRRTGTGLSASRRVGSLNDAIRAEEDRSRDGQAERPREGAVSGHLRRFRVG